MERGEIEEGRERRKRILFLCSPFKREDYHFFMMNLLALGRFVSLSFFSFSFSFFLLPPSSFPSFLELKISPPRSSSTFAFFHFIELFIYPKG